MSPKPLRRYASIAAAAEHAGCSTKTIRRMISRGDLTGYRITGSRMIRVDLDELERLIRPIPTAG